MCDVYPTIWDGKGAAGSFNRHIFSRTNFVNLTFFGFLCFIISLDAGFSLIRARICKLFKEPRNQFPAWRAGTTIPIDVPARLGLHRLAESIPGNRFLGSLNVYKYGLRNAVSSGGAAGNRERLARPRDKAGRHQVS
jgi:hypothetical protein